MEKENAGGSGISIPVIAGLAVGIVFVIAFALVVANLPTTTATITNTITIESVELDLRQRVSELGFNAYAVNFNPLTKTIEVVTDDPAKNEQVRALFDRYYNASDILPPIKLENSDLTIEDFCIC